jgi:2-succinyl-5-enolpyruvyl-6-hydroxy-3-cyclohexene-1-carboxylate synthase
MGWPVAVVCTSGTAVAEFLPAVIESYYEQKPLILVTADRPKSFRGTGSPQTIDQKNIFGNYVENCFDLDIDSDMAQFKNQHFINIPQHFNLCFDEPLVDSSEIAITEAKSKSRASQQFKISKSQMTEPIIVSSPLVIISGLSIFESSWVKNILLNFNIPVLAESTSNIWGRYPARLFVNEIQAQKWIRNKLINSIIRIGSVPTTRIWRDLEKVYAQLPVYTFTDSPWTGLARKTEFFGKLGNLEQLQITNVDQLVKNMNKNYSVQFLELLKRYPQSEISLVYALTQICQNERIYIGNSLPIREIDELGLLGIKFQEVIANRGANGIDGQISTFLGGCQMDQKNWCLVGDLTALYDLQSLWALKYIPNLNIRIIVINNSGGQIFSKIFGDNPFINPHAISFAHWAQMFGVHNISVKNPEDLNQETQFLGPLIIELIPDNHQSKKLQDEISKI